MTYLITDKKDIKAYIFYLGKKRRRMRILGACIFLSFLVGKLRDFKLMLLTCHETKKKKRIMAHAYFGRLYFLKVFWREK